MSSRSQAVPAADARRRVCQIKRSQLSQLRLDNAVVIPLLRCSWITVCTKYKTWLFFFLIY